MKSNRRNFIKLGGLAGVSLVSSGILPACAPAPGKNTVSNLNQIK